MVLDPTTGLEQPPEIPPVTAPDVEQMGGDLGKGLGDSALLARFFHYLYLSLLEGLKVIISLAVSAFDEVLSLIVPAVTAGQGFDTTGFYDLVAAILNDTLGVEVAGADIAQAHDTRGTIPAMQQVGKDLLNTLLNEFVTGTAGSTTGGGSYGLPGSEGQQLTPQQGIDAARAFLGFILSFSVRQGNVAAMVDAISFHWLGQIREYGEMMARNLGLGRLSRRVMQPLIQTCITTPFQKALNEQYRPHELDAKQLAAAYLRGQISGDALKRDLAFQGYTDRDAGIVLDETKSRFTLEELYLMRDQQLIPQDDWERRVAALGYGQEDTALINKLSELRLVQKADAEYIRLLAADLFAGAITQADFDAAINSLRIPKVEADALSRNAVHRAAIHQKHLSYLFLHKAYMENAITLDEFTSHIAQLGYNQEDQDIIEQVLLVDQKLAAAAAAKKAAAVAARAQKLKDKIAAAIAKAEAAEGG